MSKRIRKVQRALASPSSGRKVRAIIHYAFSDHHDYHELHMIVEYMDELFLQRKFTIQLPNSISPYFRRFSIFSTGHPMLTSSAIYLWGSDPRRYFMHFAYNFPSREAREEFFKAMFLALEDWSLNWEGWKELEHLRIKGYPILPMPKETLVPDYKWTQATFPQRRRK